MRKRLNDTRLVGYESDENFGFLDYVKFELYIAG